MADIPLVPAGSIPLAATFGPTGRIVVADADGNTRTISLDALYAALEGQPLNTRVFNLASRVGALGFAATPPAVGTVVSHPDAAYRYLGTGTAISDMPGWAPDGDHVTPWHMGQDPDGVTDAADALEEADEYVASREGKVLVINGIVPLARKVSLRSRAIHCRGLIRPTSAFDATAGHVIRLGEDTDHLSGHDARLDGNLFFDAFDYCGRAVGIWRPSSGVFPSTGFEAGPILAGDSFVALDSGTVAGTAFTTDHRLVALVDNPSSAVLPGNWAKRNALTMVDVKGLARPFPNISIHAMNADRVLLVEGNSEKCNYEVAGWYCHSLLHESAYDGSSPDNNKYLVRGNQFGRAYSNDGTVVSHIHFETQVQLKGYERPVAEMVATRKQTLTGTIRAPYWTAVRVDQDPDTANTAVQFLGLTVLSPEDSGQPWLDVHQARGLIGTLNCSQPHEGLVIREAAGVDLSVHLENVQGGTLYRLGRTATAESVKRGRLTITANSVDALVQGGRIERMSDFEVVQQGACPSVVVTEATRSRLVLPVRAFIDGASGVPVTRPDGVDLDYVGTDFGSVTQATDKATAVTVNALEGRITTHGASMATATTVVFVVNDDRVERGDHIKIGVRGPVGGYTAAIAGKGVGLFHVALTRVGAGSAAEAVEIHFKVRKGSLVS